jgi:hypothetical protein
MKDTISEEDMLVDVTKIELEKRLDKFEKETDEKKAIIYLEMAVAYSGNLTANLKTLYNKLKEKQKWLVSLGDIKKKYPKFCIRHIHPNNMDYYWNKKEIGKYFG